MTMMPNRHRRRWVWIRLWVMRQRALPAAVAFSMVQLVVRSSAPPWAHPRHAEEEEEEERATLLGVRPQPLELFASLQASSTLFPVF